MLAYIFRLYIGQKTNYTCTETNKQSSGLDASLLLPVTRNNKKRHCTLLD